MLLTSFPNWKQAFPTLANNPLAGQIAIQYVTKNGVTKPVIYMLATGANTPQKISSLAQSLGFSDKNSNLIVKSIPKGKNGQFSENLCHSVSLGFANDQLINKINQATYSWSSSSSNTPLKLASGNYSTRITNAEPVKQEPVRTQADVEKDIKTAHNNLNAYLATLTPEQKMEFYKAWQALDHPNIKIAQESTRVQASLAVEKQLENKATAHKSPVQVEAEKYQAKFSSLQQETASNRWKEQQHDIVVRIGGVGDLVIAGSSLFFAVVTAETGVGFAAGIYMTSEFATSGVTKIIKGTNYNNESLTNSLVTNVAHGLGASDETAQKIGERTAMSVRAAVPAAAAVKSTQYALNAFSTTTAVANTAFAIDNAAQAGTQIYNATTGAQITVPWWDGATHTFGELPIAFAGVGMGALQGKVMNNEPIN